MKPLMADHMWKPWRQTTCETLDGRPQVADHMWNPDGRPHVKPWWQTTREALTADHMWNPDSRSHVKPWWQTTRETPDGRPHRFVHATLCPWTQIQWRCNLKRNHWVSISALVCLFYFTLAKLPPPPQPQLISVSVPLCHKPKFLLHKSCIFGGWVVIGVRVGVGDLHIFAIVIVKVNLWSRPILKSLFFILKPSFCFCM